MVCGAVSGRDGAMNADRRLRLWNLVAEHADGDAVAVKDVCAAAIEVTGADNAAVTVLLSATPRETVYASDRVASELEELALTLGEGPTVDALAGSPTLVADLTAPECLIRWPMYAPEAVDAGIRAVFALPLQVGAIRLGVLDLYRAKPGDLDRDQEADALMLADTACALLLDSAERDPPRRERREPEQASLQHPEVHQATGMITVQLGVTAAVALIRLRAYAYTNGRRLREAAGEVVARTLRFSADSDGGGHTSGGPGVDGSHGGAGYGT
jgi:phenylpyruvate tautomerase PptA (4-oxalocrotonate tautomerase family)